VAGADGVTVRTVERGMAGNWLTRLSGGDASAQGRQSRKPAREGNWKMEILSLILLLVA
jgi:hypothetical protein